MNPVTVMAALQALEALLAAGPQIYADVEAIKSAGAAGADDIAALEAKIEAIDQMRLVSWAEADAALTAAARV